MNFILVSNIPCTFKDYDGATENCKTYDSYYLGYTPSYGTWTLFSGSITANDVSGYAFLGWYTIEDCTVGTVDTSTIRITTNKQLTLSQINSAGRYRNGPGPESAYMRFVCAKYEQIPSYTVTFADWNGTTLKTQTVSQGGSATPPANPTRSGYTFAGWSGNYTNVTRNETVTATYTPNTYTLTYDANGGSVSPSSKSVTYGSQYGTLPTPTKTGYSFSGWYTASAGGTQVTSSTVCSGNATIYAHWSGAYTVTVNPGSGGTGGSSPGYSFSPTITQYLQITLPTRSGYVIESWSESGASGGTPSVSGTTLTIPAGTYGNITITPTWTVATYTVEFIDWDGRSLKTETVYHGGNATPPANPTRSGWTFSSWSGSYTIVTSDRTITATYTPNTYAVSLTTNGGTIGSGNVTQYVAGTGATLPTDVTKTGHTFAGWYANADLSGAPVSRIGPDDYGDKAFYAKWTIATYAVTLHTNGGTIRSGNVTRYTFGNGATLPTDVAKTGFGFGGWFAAPDFSGDRAYAIPPDATGDKTFYAKWVEALTVTFADYDGTVLKTEIVPYGDDATPPDDPVREGYDFSGWNGSYTNVTSDRTITATYAAKSFTVTFKDLDGTTLKTETVEWGSSATAPSVPTHTGYTFIGWSRDFTDVRENIEVFALYNGAANYKIRGRRWQRLYTAATATPVYAAESDASIVARTICEVPWTETSGNFVSCFPAHPGSEEGDEHNVSLREYFDAAAFCAGHKDGMHRVYAQATCYRFALPASAVGKKMNTLSLVVNGDPYLRDGARISVLTNSTGVIPTDCTTCRTGDIHAEGLAKRTVSADGSRWYAKTEEYRFSPPGGLTLGTHLFVFVILENYAYSRGEYIEGSAYIQPNLEIGMATTVGEWTTDGVNRCYEDLTHAYNVCRDGILPESTGDVSGVQTITLQRSGDPITGTLHTAVTDAQSCIGLRAIYAALYERRLTAVAKSVALAANAREGAGFVIRGDQESVGGTNVKTWQLTTAALLVPFAVPVMFRADKVRLDWSNWSGGATSGGRFNVWLKRGTFVTDYPTDVLKNPKLYDATAETVDGYELVGTIDATQSQKTATFQLGDPIGGYVATILLTAFISLDDLNPATGMTLPQGVATALDVNPDGSSMSGKGTGWRPDITLLG